MNAVDPSDNDFPKPAAGDEPDFHNFPLDRPPYSRIIYSWLELSDNNLDRLEQEDFAGIKQWLEVEAQSGFAWQRGSDLAAIVQQRAPEGLRPITTVLVGLFSALVVGGSAMLALEGRNPVAVGVGGVVAGGAAVAANLGAARYLKHLTIRHNTLQALAQLQAAQLETAPE
ncbi:MAG: hypothetical protein VKK04_12840 [Synechococcales bacterium]|nr:hypothetical protein [Synechococcales bacterium]